MNLPEGWTLNADTDTYLYGTPHDGAGVFREDGQWHANVIHPLQFILEGPFPSRADAMRKAVTELTKLRTMC